jgi:simple sugar transport system ATP-binding protein
MQLELRHISKTFGPLKANRDISYTFAQGQTYAILGENGAGKSTLMKIIAGYQAPDAGGELLINGRPVRITSPHDAITHGIGMLYQDPLDFAPMTVLENYITARPKQGFLPDWAAHRAELLRLSRRFGFSLDPQRHIESLTIGERQQLEIVRLLSLHVQLLILDEPTTGISEEQRQQLFSTLRQLAQEDGLTIAIVTHKLADVEALCDEGLVLRHGQMAGTFTMPTPPQELVRLMFGQSPPPDEREAVPLGDPILAVQDLTLQTRLMSIPQISLEVKAGEVIGLAGLDGSGQVDFMRACAGLNHISWRDHIASVVAFAFLSLVFGLILGYSTTVLSVLLAIAAAVTLSPLALALYRAALRPSEAIRFAGQPIGRLNYRDLRGRGLAFLSAGRLEEGLVAGLTPTQHVALTEKSAAPVVNWGQSKRKTQEAIQIFDIRGQPTSLIQTLSGGNQQRVALALLPPDLKLAFLENPTRGLDVNSARNIWHLLLERRKGGTAIVFSSPDLDEIVQYSDRVLVFSSGRCTLVEERDAMNAHRLGLLIGGKDGG